MHLIIEGYGNDPQKLQDTEFIFNFLNTYPKQIGMTKVSSPKVTWYENASSTEKSVSGFVLLAESHISIHIIPEESYINIDIFSCNEFGSEQVISGLQQHFSLTEVKSYILNRPHPDIE